MGCSSSHVSSWCNNVRVASRCSRSEFCFSTIMLPFYWSSLVSYHRIRTQSAVCHIQLWPKMPSALIVPACFEGTVADKNLVGRSVSMLPVSEPWTSPIFIIQWSMFTKKKLSDCIARLFITRGNRLKPGFSKARLKLGWNFFINRAISSYAKFIKNRTAHHEADLVQKFSYFIWNCSGSSRFRLVLKFERMYVHYRISPCVSHV